VRDDSAGLGDRPVLSVRGVAAPLPGPAAGNAPPLPVFWQGQVQDLARVADGLPGLARAQQPDAPLAVTPGRASDRVALLSRGDLLAELPRANPQALRGKLMQIGWTHRFEHLARRHQKGLLHIEMSPGDFGGTFMFGEQLSFSVRTPATAWLVLMNVDAEGKVSVLYPYTAAETAPLPAGRLHTLPTIQVREPEGQDHLIALAFDRRPEGLDRLRGVMRAEPEDPRLGAVEGWLQTHSGAFWFAPQVLRAVAPESVRQR
jgi:hypothetical protein